MFEIELAELEQHHLLRKPHVIMSSDGTRVTIEGKSLLLMCSNDYLGLSRHPSLREAACAAARLWGVGSGAARLVSGTSSVHQELEFRLARFKCTEAAILFNSGYAANTGIIPALAGDSDTILSDSLNHASIIDGCRLSRASVNVYRHKDMNHLEELLKQSSASRRKLIITDGIFSMDGDIAPLRDIVSLSEKYDAMLMVDDAHATGVLGKSGRGTAEHFGLEGRVHIQMGTLGKALGSFGAYVAGKKSLIEYLLNRSRSYCYSTSLPAAVCAASIAAIDILENDPGPRERLWNNQKRFIGGLRKIGISPGSSESPIVPIIIGNTEKALTASARLFDHGIYATAIRPPAVMNGFARIRMTIMAIQTETDIDSALDAVAGCKKEGFL
jgi:glycine C-acetyltransferase